MARIHDTRFDSRGTRETVSDFGSSPATTFDPCSVRTRDRSVLLTHLPAFRGIRFHWFSRTRDLPAPPKAQRNPFRGLLWNSGRRTGSNFAVRPRKFGYQGLSDMFACRTMIESRSIRTIVSCRWGWKKEGEGG